MKKRSDAKKLVRDARRYLGLNGENQQALLRKVRKALDLTNGELAQALGVKPATLMAYLAPETAGKHRVMPGEYKLILQRLLSERKSANGKR
jgi:DNA-binding XRE family transcriptional regulator